MKFFKVTYDFQNKVYTSLNGPCIHFVEARDEQAVRDAWTFDFPILAVEEVPDHRYMPKWIDYEVLRSNTKTDSFKVTKQGMDRSVPHLESFYTFDGQVTTNRSWMYVWNGKFDW